MAGFFGSLMDALSYPAEVDRAEQLYKKDGLTIPEIAEKMRVPEEKAAALVKAAIDRTPKPIDLYVVWDTDANSWNGVRSIRSMHQTLKGALAAIPDSEKKDRVIEEQKDRPENWSRYIYDFEGLAIEKRSIGE